MAQYLVTIEHTPDECLRTLDEIVDYDPDLIDQFWFTCGDGAHTGSVVLDAQGETAAIDRLPPSLRSGADVTPVRRYTMHSVEALHRMAA